MASKSLGQLTLDVVAQVGSFTGPLEKAERASEKWRRQVASSMAAAGTAVAAAAGVAAGGMALWVKSSIDSAAELGKLAQAAGVSTTEFQKFAAGANKVGIAGEELSQIFVDVNDKFGDFFTTGGGELKDFFDVVLPKIGLTAEAFRGLGGREALELFYSSAEKAGANTQELTFLMEGLASGSSKLIPMLANSGAGMKAAADEAERFGLILSDETIQAAKQFEDNLSMLGKVVDGVGTQVAAELLPHLKDLTETLKDPATVEAAKTLAKGIISALNGIASTAQAVGWAVTEMRRAFGDADAASIDHLEQEGSRLQSIQAKLIAQGYGEGTAVYDNITQSLEKVSAQLDEAYERMERNAKAASALPPTTSPPANGGKGLGIDTGAAEKATKASQDAAKAEREREAAAREAQRVWDESYRSQIALAAEVAGVVESTWTDQQRVMDEYQKKVQTLREGVLAGVLTEDAAGQAVGLLDSQLTQRLDELGETTGTFWEEWLVAAEENLTSFDELSASVIENFGAGVGSAFEGMLTGTQDLDDALLGLAQNTVQSVINALGQMAAQWVALQAVQLVLGKSSQTSAITGAATTGTAMASAYAPAAAMASLASFGANSAPAIAGMTAATTTAQGLAFAGLFDNGGQIGAGQWGIVGELGPEIVTGPANVTGRRDTAALLDRASKDVQGNASNVPNVIVNNYSSARVQTRLNDAGELELLIEEMDKRLAGRIYADESKTGKAIERVFANRRPIK